MRLLLKVAFSLGLAAVPAWAASASELRVAQSFCRGIPCSEIEPTALDIARQFDRDASVPAQPLESSGQDAVKRMEERAVRQKGFDQLPTFGAPLHAGFEANALRFPVIIDGTLYLGQISHALRDGRAAPDYVLALYLQIGDAIAPVAGFYISRAATSP